MTKRTTKKDDQNATAVAEPPTTEPVVMSSEEIEAIRKELADAKRKLRAMEKRNKAIIDAEKAVDSWKRDLDNLTAELNDTRKSWKQAVERLQAEIKRNERQGELEFDGKPAATVQPAAASEDPKNPPIDAAVATKLSDVPGFTDSTREKLASIDVSTVGELEQAMREGKIVPGRVKGLGEKIIDKISDALRAFREANPVERDDRPKRCKKPGCGVEYPGELSACPTCNETVYERVEPEPNPPAAEQAMAEQAAVEPESPADQSGTVFDPQTRSAA